MQTTLILNGPSFRPSFTYFPSFVLFFFFWFGFGGGAGGSRLMSNVSMEENIKDILDKVDAVKEDVEWLRQKKSASPLFNLRYN